MPYINELNEQNGAKGTYIFDTHMSEISTWPYLSGAFVLQVLIIKAYGVLL